MSGPLGKKNVLFTFSCLVIFLAATSTVAFAQKTPLVIEGRVVNGTDANNIMSGLTITLHQQTPEADIQYETISDNLGRFQFDVTALDTTIYYGISTRYQGVLYNQSIDTSASGQNEIVFKVYDTSTTDNVVHASSVSVLFANADTASQVISVLEIIALENASNHTYVPGPDPMSLLRFGLPTGAQDLTVDTSLSGADYIQVDRGFALLTSLPPGEHEVLISYLLPYSGTETSVTKSLPYGAGRFRILAPSEVLTLTSTQFPNIQKEIIGERKYQLIEATSIAKGTKVSLNLRNLPESSLVHQMGKTATNVPLEYTAALGLGVLMILIIAFALWSHYREDSSNPGYADMQWLSSETAIHELKRKVYETDKEYEDGNLSRKEYIRRSMLLKRLLTSPPHTQKEES